MATSKFERRCICCGGVYEYCPNCSKFSNQPRWRDAYDTENCKDLYNVTAGYINGWKTPQEELARLKKLDLSYKSKLPDWMKKAINELLALEETEETQVVEETVDVVTEEESEEPEKVEEVVEPEVEVDTEDTSVDVAAEEQLAEEVVVEQVNEPVVEKTTVQKQSTKPKYSYGKNSRKKK